MSTFGLWDIKPNFYNAVPRSVRVDIDIRDSDKERRDSIITQTLDGAKAIAAQRKCGHTGEVKFDYPVARSDKKVRSGMLTKLCHLLRCLSSTTDAAMSAHVYNAQDYMCMTITLVTLQAPLQAARLLSRAFSAFTLCVRHKSLPVQVLNAIQRATDALGVSSKRMVSRAYHDAAFMAQIAPAAMIFVPSKDGLSHHPSEHTATK